MKSTTPTLESLLAIIEAQAETIKQLQAKIADLEKRLNKNSRNSSKPPSSDGLSKPPRTTSLREKGRNKSGGQLGHKGETLKQVSFPDIVITHSISHCPDCGNELSSNLTGEICRQVFDIPPVQLFVTEHRAEVKHCACCKRKISALFPEDVTAPVQYGERIKSLALYLQHQHFIPEERLQQIFGDVFGVSLSTATLSRVSEVAYRNLSQFEEVLFEKIKSSPVKHLDETGFRVSAKTQWLHTASTEHLTYYHVSPKRKSLLQGLTGVVVHDHWRPYFQLPDVKHALCNQHHLRELTALIEHEKEAWARKMKRLLRCMLRYRHYYGDNPIPPRLLNRLNNLYSHIVYEGFVYHEKNLLPAVKKRQGRVPNRPGHNFLIRLRDYREDVLRFLHEPNVPFTNNLAERDLRMMKCKQKISGGFRAQQGADIFARIRGFISTARKQGWNVFDSIQDVFSNQIPQLF